MAVQVRLCLLVTDANDVVILNVHRVGEHDVVAQCLLESWSHEIVARARAIEDSKVHLEPKQVEDEGQDDQAYRTRSEVLSKLRQAYGASTSLDVEQIPKINGNGRANGDKGKEADVLGRDVARQSIAGQDQPLPPLTAEGLMATLVELDVEQQAAGHGENEGCIKEDQASLSNVRIVQQDQGRGDYAGRHTVARLPHNEICNRDGQGSQNSRKRTERDVGNLVGNVRVADVFEVEMAVVAHEPTHEGEKQLSERRVDIEKVCSLEIVGSEL